MPPLPSQNPLPAPSPRRPLGNSGLLVGPLGFGAASLGEEYGEIDPLEALPVVPAAIDAGIDLLDTSPYYGRGRSEVLLGYALRGIPRERYRLCTKLGRYGPKHFNFSPRRIRESVDTSLHRLNTDHLDIVLCHDIEFVDIARIVESALPTLRALQREGKIRAVGASAYPVAALRRVVEEGELDVILSYANWTLHNRRLGDILPLCAERDVGVINAAPFDMRLLTHDEPPAWHPAPPDLRRAVAAARDACERRGQSLARLAFQFALQSKGPNDLAPATTVVGTAYPEQLHEWLHWTHEPLDADLLAEVESLLAPVRDRARIVGRPENN